MLEENTPKSNNDPFAYLSRENFTSEKFKIEIRGLPKIYGINELKKLINGKLKLKSCKIKPPKRCSEWLYVSFRSEEDRQFAISTLSGYVWKKKTLSVQIASAAPDPLIQKRTNEKNQNSYQMMLEKQHNMSNVSNEELLKFCTAPLWNIPYEKQLEIKMVKMRTVLEEMSKNLLRENKMHITVKNILEKQYKQYNGIICELCDIKYVSSELMPNEYRNKCEFTIGINEENGFKTIGFRIGAYVQGSTNVGPITHLPHVPTKMKEVVNSFENFVRKSELNVYSHEDHTGFWKQLTVRLGINTNQLMIIIGSNVDSIVVEKLPQIKFDIKKFFEEEEGRLCNVTSLYFQAIDMKSNQKPENEGLELLLGTSTIVEELCGLKFYISPLSFFQPNTAAAEILFNSVLELIPLTDQSTLLDICCGTGSIGLCLAKSGAQILGIESEFVAIENAKLNCKENNIDNCTFFLGKAENILTSVICKAKYNDIIAIVDPPRAGLHQKTINQLRRARNIKKIVYFSCNPAAALKNFVSLGRPQSKTLLGNQFFPVKAIPVDNFPHTNHCELILYFERYENCKL